MRRRDFLTQTAFGLCAGSLFAQSDFSEKELLLGKVPAADSEDERFRWFDLAKLPLEGLAWADEERVRDFDRFPKRIMPELPEAVRGLARHSAGIAFRFVSDSSQIRVKYELLSESLAMPHMPASGVSGFDLYSKSEGRFRFVGAKYPLQVKDNTVLADNIAPSTREFLINFPLYNGVNAVSVGVEKDADFRIPPPRKGKPLLFYGTSITQGGCASRPGLAHPQILGRRLDREVLNFGFSGSGKMEPALAQAFAELDPAVYILDCVPNMTPELIRERVRPFVRALRLARPNTPILLVEDAMPPDSWIIPARRDRHRENQKILRESYQLLLDGGIKELYYLEGDDLCPPDGDGTVDSVHPNDYGFEHYADAFEPVLRKILE